MLQLKDTAPPSSFPHSQLPDSLPSARTPQERPLGTEASRPDAWVARPSSQAHAVPRGIVKRETEDEGVVGLGGPLRHAPGRTQLPRCADRILLSFPLSVAPTESSPPESETRAPPDCYRVTCPRSDYYTPARKHSGRKSMSPCAVSDEPPADPVTDRQLFRDDTRGESLSSPNRQPSRPPKPILS